MQPLLLPQIRIIHQVKKEGRSKVPRLKRAAIAPPTEQKILISRRGLAVDHHAASNPISRNVLNNKHMR